MPLFEGRSGNKIADIIAFIYFLMIPVGFALSGVCIGLFAKWNLWVSGAAGIVIFIVTWLVFILCVYD